MSASVITTIDQITPAWLTSVLTRSGALIRGAVQSFALGTGRGNWSTSANLALTYTDDAQGERPTRLFLKMVVTDLGDGETFGDSEVTYYTRDYVDVPDAPLLRCYHAAYSSQINRYHLLLQDVSETHLEAGDRPPTLAYGLALAGGLAALHARWWGAEKLKAASAPIHDTTHFHQFVEIAAPGVEHILGSYSNQLAPHWPSLIHEIFRAHPTAMMARTRDLNGFTLIHGDVGSANVLVPRAGDRPLYIIDRQPFNWSLTTWLGVYDLAYSIVLDWDVSTRHVCEMPILRHYHQCLLENGVQAYAWDQLLADYKLCVAMGVYIAVEYCRGGLNEKWIQTWLPMLQRALTACDDLNGREIWSG